MRDTLTTFVIVSFAYIISYSLTSGFVYPIQTTLLPDVSDKIGLLFLPHGVRIIAIYYYGWRAILLLLPASYLMWFLTVYRGEIGLSLYAPIISLVACWIGVTLAKVVFEEKSKMLDMSAWKFLIVAGAAGSLLNGIGLSFLQHDSQVRLSILGYMIGDMAGLFASLFILIYVFRLLRNYPEQPQTH
jgi:hypothetical protein